MHYAYCFFDATPTKTISIFAGYYLDTGLIIARWHKFYIELIKRETVDLIIETARIEDVVGDFLNLKRKGGYMLGLCPFHHEKTPSFTVTPSRNIYKCFGCGKAGTPIQFIMDHEHMTFPDALRYLANKYQIKIEEEKQTDEDEAKYLEKESLHLVLQFAGQWYENQLWSTDEGKSVGVNYFKERGLREATLRKFGVGYAPDDKDILTREAIKAGYNIEKLKITGLTNMSGRDFFSARVMFPIHNLSGKIIGFGGRIMDKGAKVAKYINSPETEVYNKSKILYGAFQAKQAIRKYDKALLVEGYTDVVSMHQSGIENVVASSGTSLTIDQIRLIKRYTNNVGVLYDGDQAGIKAALRGIDLLLEEDMNVTVTLLPEGEDPDSYIRKNGENTLSEYIAAKEQDFILFKSEILLKETTGNPFAQSEAIKDIVASISKIPDALRRTLYIRACSQRFNIPETVLMNENNDQLREAYKKQRLKQINEKEKIEKEWITEEKQRSVQPDIIQSISPNEYQEKDIVRIIISSGHKLIPPEDEQVSLGSYILSSLEDLDQMFENDLYRRIMHEYQHKVLAEEYIDTNFFLYHDDPMVRDLSIDLMTFPYNYSENWLNKLEIALQSQLEPEHNFMKEADQALKRFKLRKINRAIDENLVEIARHEGVNDEEHYIHLKMHQKLQQMRTQIAKELNTVVTRI